MPDHTPFTAVVITSTAGSRTVTVIRESYGRPASDGGSMMQGIAVSSLMSTFLGIKDCVVLQPGTRVLCLPESNNTCYVLGALPANSAQQDELPNRAALGAGNAIKDGANRLGHTSRNTIIKDNRRPSDIVDGEFAQGNEFGILLGLYQQLANLKASELSQIQCFLLDDLVRIISHNFQHYTALGEYNIYHDGKHIMAEFGATHKPAESYGRPAVNSDSGAPIFQGGLKHTVDDKEDFYKINEDERIKAVERFKMFLGSVGDFLHLFVVRPDPDEARVLDPDKTPNKPDTGLCDIRLGSDGGLMFRSVKEVILEKTQWIRVPHRKAAPDDPKGDDGEQLDYEVNEQFNFKDTYTYKNNPFLYALQIRDYMAYVNEKLGYKNFKKHEKDFYVNDDINKENKISDFGNIDKDTKLFLQNYKLRTSGIYLMPNGGITIRDAWNSAIVMEGGNICIQPAKDLLLQPMRNTILKSGGFVSIAAQKDIDLSTTKGGFRVKSKLSQYLYSDEGGFVLEANGSEDSPGTPDPSSQALEKIGGVVLKSKLGIYNYAEKNIMHYAKQKLLLQSLQEIDLTADQNITLYGKQNIFSLAEQNNLVYGGLSTTIISDGESLIAGAGGTAFGQKDQFLGIQYDDKSMFVDVLKGVIPVSDITGKLDTAKKAKENLLKLTTFSEEAKFTNLKFHWLSSDKYGNLNPQEDAIPMTLAQQEDLLTGVYSYSSWNETEVNSSLPYPGKDKFSSFYYKGEAPINLESNSLGTDYSNKADSKPNTGNITLSSLQEYKVTEPK